MENCVFCKIINHEIPADVISDTASIIVFMSLENHPLVVPKKHIKDIYELDPETGYEIMKEVTNTAKAVKKGLSCEGIYITQANEPAAGQDVFHIHFHIYSRWQGKIINQSEKVDNNESTKTYQKIKNALG